jgi:hypothetical protein
MPFNTLWPMASFCHFSFSPRRGPPAAPRGGFVSSISLFRAPQPTAHALPDARLPKTCGAQRTKGKPTTRSLILATFQPSKDGGQIVHEESSDRAAWTESRCRGVDEGAWVALPRDVRPSSDAVMRERDLSDSR